jgi:predicted O-linked N-acetylglucosamine transferase (SPINDLY family)
MGNSEKIEQLRAKATELHRNGQLAEAERLYQGILGRRSRDLEARHMLGLLRLQQGRSAEALLMLSALAAEVPDHAEIRTHHGLVLHDLGRHREALAELDRALAIKPGNAMTLLYRGNVLAESGSPLAALESYDRLLAAVPNHDEAWFRRGGVLWRLDRLDDALGSYARALIANPHHVAARFNGGTVLLKLERYDEAFAAFEEVRALAPGHPYALGGSAAALAGGADLARWEDFRRLLLEAVRDRRGVIPPLAFLPFCDDGGLRRICAETFAADRVRMPQTPPRAAPRYRHARIRLAYLSADFHQHATAELIAGLIERHDRAQFEVTAISFGQDDAGAMRARLVRAFDRFVDVRDKTDAEVADFLRQGEYDIAIDLKGHTEGARAGILAQRPCPLQVGYLGYPGTVGAPWLDYILADAVVLPFDQAAFYSEKIVHLPNCYQANDETRPIGSVSPTRAQAGLPEDGFVFCCFNAAWKIAPAMFDVWMRLLGKVPGSVLWLLGDNPATMRNLRAAATARGIDSGRLVFAPRTAPCDHLARHKLADLFVDTLPYNAHTTASDALWTGLPVVTCLGAAFDGRVAASLLSAAGLPELVTHSVAQYEELALALAGDRARLARVRETLVRNRLRVPLFDTGRFRRNIEQAYLRMMEILHSGQPPQSFSVRE